MADTSSISNDLLELAMNDNDQALAIKEETTAGEISSQSSILQYPLNWTDPIVWHDPIFNRGVIVKGLNTDLGNASANDTSQTGYKVDAVYFPLLKINQNIIDNSNIIYFKMETKGLIPELTVQILDMSDKITATNSSGMNSDIIAVITSPVDGVYRKIKLPFYVTSVTSQLINGQRYMKYNGKLKVNKLYQKHSTAMNYPNDNQWPGCEKCKQPEQKMPNSWEMLHFIANECELGFASTKQCKEISDRIWRRLNSYNSLYHCLESEKKYAGIDEEEAIFDWWIDLYGYLVMVNVPWVMNEDINEKHLGMYAVSGVQPTDDSCPEPEVILMNRALSNATNVSTTGKQHNLMIKSYEILTDNSLYDTGVCTTNHVFMPKGAGGENGIEVTDIQVQENSMEGTELGMYNTQRVYMRGVDMSGCNKILKTVLFDTYFKKHRAKRLKVELETFNLGLQRGTLVNIIIMESNPANKSTIMNNLDNMAGTQEGDIQRFEGTITEGELRNDGVSNTDAVADQSVQILNPALSGLYYIDGIEFIYDKNKGQRISQILYLLKKGVWANYTSVVGPYKFDKNRYEK